MEGHKFGPISNFVFGMINLVVMRRTLKESMARKEKYTKVQENRFKVIREVITFANIWLLKLSGGRLGNSFLGVTLLLMTTIGRKTGKPRTLPMYYLQDGEKVVLVASNGGLPSNPVWFLNVMANPNVTIQIAGVKQEMVARVASQQERDFFWPQLTSRFSMWQEVYERSNREFPVVILEKQTQAQAQLQAKTSPASA